MAGRHPAGPGDRRRRRQPDHQRPRGVHAGQRVHPRRVRRPRVLRRRRVLRPRHRRRRRDRPADRELDRRRRARARPVADGHPAVRRRPTGGRARTPSPARSRSTRPTTTSTTRTRSARPAGRCGRRRRTTRWRRSARCSARSPAGSARTGSSPTPTTRASAGARRSRRSGRAAGRASTGRPAIAAEALATRRGRRALRRDVVRQARGRRAGRLRVPPAAVRGNDVDRPVGLDRLHPAARPPRRDPGRPDGHAAGARIAFLLVTGTAVRQPRRGWLRTHLPDDGSRRAPRRHLGRVCFGLWGPRARDLLAPLTTRRRLRRRLPVPDRARRSPSGRCRCSPCGSPTSASSAGSCTPRPSTGARCGTTLWEAGREHGLVAGGLPGDRRAPAREGLPRLVVRHHARRDAVRGRPRASRSRSTRRSEFIGREALVAAKAAGPAQAAALPRPRRPARRSASATSRSGSTATVVGRVTSGGYGFAVERSIAYAYLPPDARRSARAARSRCSASGSASRSSASRCTTRPASGSGRERTRRSGADWSASLPARHRRRAARLARGRPRGLRRGRRDRPVALPARPRDRRPSPTGRS